MHAQPLGGAEADVGDGGRDEARAARVLDRHLEAELGGDVAHEDRLRDPADPLQLDRDPVGDAFAVGAEQVVQRHDRLVEDERPVGGAARTEAHSAYVRHGCSSTYSSSRVARRNCRAVAAVKAPLASA